MRDPRTNDIPLEKPLTLEFLELIQETVIFLMHLDLIKFEIIIKILNLLKEGVFVTNLKPLTKKKKEPGKPGPSSQVGKGKDVMRVNPSKPKPMMMNSIIWNVREANNAEFIRHCKYMISIHKHVILVLLETRMIGHKSLTEELDFSNQIQFEAIGNSVGIVLLCMDDVLNIQDISVSNQIIHVFVKVNRL